MMYISDVIPDPRGSGSEQRAYSILKSYARKHKIELWCHPRGDKPEAKRIISCLDLVDDVIFFYPPVLSPKSHLTARFLAALSRADFVHMFKFPVRFQHPNIIWDVDELPDELKNSGSLVISGDPIEQLSSDSRAYVEFAKRCRNIMASSPLERSAFIRNITHVSNSYPVPIEKPKRSVGRVLLYVGHLGYWPNIDAINYFLEDIFPRLPSELIFRIVGRRPNTPNGLELLKRIANLDRVEYHLDVPSCTPYYEDAIAAIVPLRHGHGTRLKILEAITHMCPVISTTKGAEGLGMTPDIEFLRADTPDEFRMALRQLVEKSDLAGQLVDAAHHFYIRNNSQETVDRQIDQIIAELTSV